MSETTLSEISENALVFDQDSNQMVAVTKEMHLEANALQQRLNATTLVTALILKRIKDKQLYLAFQCSSFAEYADTVLPMSYGHAKKYIRIADTFAPLIPGEFEKGASTHLLESDEINQLSSLGSEKLYELSKVKEADFTEVFSSGKVTLPNGAEYTLDEIKEESARKLAENMKEFKKGLTKKLAVSEENRLKAEGERDTYKKQVEKHKALVERSYEMEAKYGAEASKVSEMQFLLDKSTEHIRELESYFGQLTIEENDPESLQEEARSILRRLNAIQYNAKQRFPWLNELEEMAVLPKELGESFDKPIEPQVIRIDTQRMAIKVKSKKGKPPYGHGWKNLEKDFETSLDLQIRFSELIDSGKYIEG